MHVRQAQPADALPIEVLYRELVPGDPNIHVAPEQLAALASDPHNQLLVAELDGVLCGTAFLTLCLAQHRHPHRGPPVLHPPRLRRGSQARLREVPRAWLSASARVESAPGPFVQRPRRERQRANVINHLAPGGRCFSKKGRPLVDRLWLRSSPDRRTARAPHQNGRETMRVMVIVKATKNSEAGLMPSEDLLTKMGKYNEDLVKAGVMLSGEGLKPSANGKRIQISGSKRTLIDGPFSETKELVAGFWIWQVKNLDEAIEWARRCPEPMPGEEATLEIRPVFETEDFAESDPSGKHREHEAELRKTLEARQK